PDEADQEAAGAPRPGWQAVLLSARSESALAASAARLLEAVGEGPADGRSDGRAAEVSLAGAGLADLAFTTQTGRSALDLRAGVVGRDPDEVRSGLRALADPDVPSRPTRTRGHHTPVTFLLPGTGDQYPGMARQLYERQPLFREALDLCATEASAL